MALQQRDGIEVVDGDAGLSAGETDVTSQVFGEIDSGDDSDLMAGYEAERTGMPTFNQPDARVGSPDAGQTDGEDAGTQGAPAAKAPTKIGRWTEDEVASRFEQLETTRKSAESLAGLVGNLKARLEAAGKPRQITTKDLPKVVDQFGEDFAGALVDDLNAVGLGGSSAVDPDVVRQIVGDGLQEYEQKSEYRAVKRQHPDADDYFNRPDANGKFIPGKKAAAFFGWIGTLTKEDQQLISNSWDRDVVGGFIERFKAHEKQQGSSRGPGAGGESAQVRSLAGQRQNRLRNAVTPQSSGAAQRPQGEDPMEAGYRAAKAGK